MDSVLIFSIVGIAFLLGVIYFTIKGKSSVDVKTKAQKKAEIITQYKDKLQKELEPLKDEKNQRIRKKTKLLQEFSAELSRNIFFDKDEIRTIISELSKE